MRIVHVIGSLNTGGAEKLLKDLLPELKNKGIDVQLLVVGSANPHIKDKLEDKKIKVVILNKSNIYNPLNIFSIVRNLKTFNYIHVHLFPSLYFISFIKVLNSKKILFYTEHNTSNKRRGKFYLKYIEKFIYSRYSKIISISLDTQLNLINWLSLNNKEHKFSIIRNGIKLEDYSNAKPIKLIGYENKKKVLMVSRFSKQKDHETLIKAFKLVSSKMKDVILLFAGEGKTLLDVRKIVDSFDLYDKVLFLGNRNDIPNLMALSDIGVQSSNWEGFGLTAVEFMASKTPVIGTDVKGLSDVIKDGGLLFKSKDHMTLAGLIIKLLNDEDLYNKMVEKGDEKSKIYSSESMTNSYMKIYKEFM